MNTKPGRIVIIVCAYLAFLGFVAEPVWSLPEYDPKEACPEISIKEGVQGRIEVTIPTGESSQEFIEVIYNTENPEAKIQTVDQDTGQVTYQRGAVLAHLDIEKVGEEIQFNPISQVVVNDYLAYIVTQSRFSYPLFFELNLEKVVCARAGTPTRPELIAIGVTGLKLLATGYQTTVSMKAGMEQLQEDLEEVRSELAGVKAELAAKELDYDNCFKATKVALQKVSDEEKVTFQCRAERKVAIDAYNSLGNNTVNLKKAVKKFIKQNRGKLPDSIRRAFVAILKNLRRSMRASRKIVDDYNNSKGENNG